MAITDAVAKTMIELKIELLSCATAEGSAKARSSKSPTREPEATTALPHCRHGAF